MNTAPPPTLSIEDFRKDWEPQGWRLITIGPTSTWREGWGTWEAIRDIVQNALDESEAYTYGFGKDGLWIADRGKGLAVADFLLGPPKLKPDYARGKFGEGMKVASLALLRLGYPLHVETVGRELWTIFLLQKVNGHVETLAALWRPDGSKRGTVFHIIGYTGSVYTDNFSVNLPRSAVIAQGAAPLFHPIQRYNQLINYKFPDGPRIFARDIYMRDIVSPFSYNLWGFDMAPDRHGPREESAMWVDVGRLWSCITKPALLKTFLLMVCDPPEIQSEEGYHIGMYESDMGMNPEARKPYAELVHDARSMWTKAWKDAFGTDAVMLTSSRLDALVRHLGYRPVRLTHGVTRTLSLAVPTDQELVAESQDRLREVTVIPDRKLNPRELASLRVARKIAAQFQGSPKVNAAIIPPASDRTRTAGMYSMALQEIYISQDQLNKGRDMVDVIIHELAHHQSQAEDGDELHNRAMTQTASYVVHATHYGTFSDELADKDFYW